MKKKKKSRIKLVGAGVTSTDRLSSLPDAILDHILSFVDTKTVVQTSILSRRWKCVWKHVHALNLDYCSFTNGYRFSKSFTSNDLETLSLYCFEIDSRFGSFDFQALTEMVLVYCDFQYGQDEFLDPFSRFPCLKNLCLRYNHKDYSGRANKLRISGPQLQNLKLFDLNIERIEISAPKLKSLTVHPVEIDGFFELDLPSLDYADIKFAGYTTCISHFEEEDWDFFFQGCCNVKSLTLCTEIIEVPCALCKFELEADLFFVLAYVYLVVMCAGTLLSLSVFKARTLSIYETGDS
ncbi:F-box protein At1g60400 [Linum perenne]